MTTDIISNFTEFLMIILGTFVALYQIWKNIDALKKSIVSSVIYSILFILGIMKMIRIEIFWICCLKEKIKRYRLLSTLRDMNQIICDAIKDSSGENYKFLQDVNRECSLIITNLTIIKERIKEKMETETSKKDIMENGQNN